MTPRARLTAALLASTALSHGSAARAGELPVGPSIVHGGVTVATPSPGTMAITQGTPTAIVNWQSFSVGPGSQVNVAQPGASSALLNRVTGATTSTIAGQVNANGQVFLVNPNGILITPGGSVKAGGGFVASTLDIRNDDFVAGRRTFSGTGASKGVVNQGAITIGQGGYAALIGGTVENAGTVSVPMGKVGLGAGERVTIDPSGDGFLQVSVPSSGIATDKDLVLHSGQISAAGGRVEMKAATAREIARQAVNVSGVVEARTVSGRPGAIVLGGGEGGQTTVSGRLVASAPSGSKARGGSVTVTGRAVALKGASIDASGAAGGGTVRIGGDYKGEGPLQRAETASADKDTRIVADALDSGRGGSIVVWSDQYTTFAGSIFARGGAVMGDGGDAEVSSKGVLDFRGRADLTAPFGRFGTLLLDPYDLYVENRSSSGVTTVSGGGTTTFTAGPPVGPLVGSVLDVTTLQAALTTANVVLSTGTGGSSGSGSITIGYPVTWATAATLTLNAAIGVNIGLGFNAPNGSVVINAPSVTNGQTYGDSAGNVFGLVGAPAWGGATLANLTINGSGSGTIDLGGTYQISGVFSVSGGSVQFRSPVTAGTLNVSATSASASGSINAGLFQLEAGTWTQVGASGTLPAFSATDFQINFSSVSSFLRVLGGTGTTGDPYLLGDVYGLQGMATSALLASNFRLANDIDASGTAAWNAGNVFGTGFVPIGGGFLATGFSGSFDGQRHTISNLTVNRPGSTDAGLFGIASGAISNVNLQNADITGGAYVGALAGRSTGPVTQVTATGRVLATGQDVGDFDRIFVAEAGGLIGENGGAVSRSLANVAVTARATGSGTGSATLTVYASAGGLVGDNAGTIASSKALGAASAFATGSGPAAGAAVTATAGGLAGFSSGGISQSASTGAASADARSTVTVSFSGGFAGAAFAPGVAGENDLNLYAGGLVGWNRASLADTYATGGVSWFFSAGPGVASTAALGGLAGFNTATVARSFATGTITPPPTPPSPGVLAGGLVGINGIGGTIGPSNAWDAVATGRTSGVGRNDAAFTATSLTTGQFQDTAAFLAFGAAQGWDFTTVWAPGAPGRYPGLYAVDPVVYVSPVSTSRVYGAPNPAFTAPIFGGPTRYVFGPAGDTLPAIPLGTNVPANAPVGTYAIGGPATVASGLGQTYAVVTGPATLTVTPAPLTVTATDQSKTYGQSFNFAGTEITTSGLLFSDTVTAAPLFSAGADRAAAVGPAPITFTGPAVGTGLGNYTITYRPGTFTVTPAALTITASNQRKTVGSAFTFQGTEFTTSGLVLGDTVTSVGLASDGAPATAGLGTYSVEFTSPAAGPRLDNYAITYVPGVFTVFDPLTLANGGPLAGQAGQFSASRQYDGNTFLNPHYATLPVVFDPPDYFLGSLLNGGGGVGNSGGAGSAGGPTLGTGQATTTLEKARAGLADVERAARELEQKLAQCERIVGRGTGAYSACVGDGMTAFATALDERVIDLPGPLKGVSAVIRAAAARVRAARTIGEARAAVQDALGAVRGAIALIRAEDPAVARIQLRQGATIRTALERCDIRLARAGQL